MTAFYSVSNKDITIYNNAGTCILITKEPIEEVMRRYNIKDSDIHVTF